jgi:hypothetical protein
MEDVLMATIVFAGIYQIIKSFTDFPQKKPYRKRSC